MDTSNLLCRFSIKYGQDIVAFTKDGHQSPTLAFPVDVQEVRTPELKAAFKSCFDETCTHHSNEQGVACHAGCAALAEGLGLTPAEYLPALAYSYEPPESDERRRRELVRFRLQHALKKNIGRFPTEVWDFVAKDLVCEFATVAIPVIEPKTTFTIDALEAVWATYVEIDGVEYVKSVSNEHKPGSWLLWDKPKSPRWYVYIAEDHLGIKEITSHPEVSQSTQSNQVSTWWRTIVAFKDSSKIDFKTDGVKLRSFSAKILLQDFIRPCSQGGKPRNFLATTLLSDVKWPYPMTPDEITGMDLYYTMLDREAKMIPVDINAPDTIGYSVGWYYGCVYFHAHKRGESLDFYHELDTKQRDDRKSAAKYHEGHEPHAIKVARMAEESWIEWRYHPLNAGEAIEQVWIRQPRKLPGDDDDIDNSPHGPRYPWTDASHDVAIGLVTNQSRVLVSGIHCEFPQDRFPWRCIAKSSTASPMRIFFSYSLNGINLFAAPKSGVPENEPVHEDLYEEEPENFCVYGYDFHTSASLEDVAQVVPCKANERGKSIINGLLLRYNDGHETTIGRFRFDCAQPPLSFAESSTLYLGFGSSESAPGEHVAEVRVSAPKDKGGLKWKKFSTKEPIQWSWRQCWCRVSKPSEEFWDASDREEDI
ncbi:hypothetical protein Neosp_003386 [[Neocosmospora] mangrovei]